MHSLYSSRFDFFNAQFFHRIPNSFSFPFAAARHSCLTSNSADLPLHRSTNASFSSPFLSVSVPRTRLFIFGFQHFSVALRNRFSSFSSCFSYSFSTSSSNAQSFSGTGSSPTYRVAIVGSGPSGMYSAKYLLRELPPCPR